MRSAFIACLICVFAVAIPSLARQAQQTPTAQLVVQRDPQAVAALQQAIVAMGTNVPSDTTLTGTVTLEAGSLTYQGSIRILTRGTTQTSVHLQATESDWTEVYSAGQAAKTQGANTALLPMETAASTQSAFFPLPILAGALGNQDVACQYIGPEELNGAAVVHIYIWNTYESIPALRFLSDFSGTDVWISATSGLPIRIAFIRRSGGGAMPRIPIVVDYSNYQAVSGTQFPFQIQESVNGTVWASITLQSVSTNTGLTDLNFPLPQAEN
jgi:hypothetical protein